MSADEFAAHAALTNGIIIYIQCTAEPHRSIAIDGPKVADDWLKETAPYFARCLNYNRRPWRIAANCRKGSVGPQRVKVLQDTLQFYRAAFDEAIFNVWNQLKIRLHDLQIFI